MNERGALKPADAAEYLGLSRSKLYELMRSGELPNFHIGKSRRIRVAAINEWMERLERSVEGAAR